MPIKDPVKAYEYARKRLESIKAGTWNPKKVPSYTPEEKKIHKRTTRVLRRLEAIQHYGGKCECCGERRYEFLAIDHINGGGRQHIKSLGGSNSAFHTWLRKNNYPTGFRVLCHNCNMAHGMYGYCPHQERPYPWGKIYEIAENIMESGEKITFHD